MQFHHVVFDVCAQDAADFLCEKFYLIAIMAEKRPSLYLS
jgi:hypothetical protein